MSNHVTIPVPMNANGDKAITPLQWRFYADIQEAEGNLANAALMHSVADAIEEQA